MTHMNGSFEDAGYETPQKKKRTGLVILLGAVSLVLIALLVAGGYLFSLARSFDSGTTKLARRLSRGIVAPGEGGCGEGCSQHPASGQ